MCSGIPTKPLQFPVEGLSRKRASPHDSGWLLGTLPTWVFVSMQDRHASKWLGSPVCWICHTLKTHSPQKICLFGNGRVLGYCSLACFPLHMWTSALRAHDAANLCITCTYRAFPTDFFAVALFSSDSYSPQFDPPSLVGSICQ